MNIHRTVSVAALLAVTVLAATLPAVAQPRQAGIAAAGSPLVVPGRYADGVLMVSDPAGKTITVGTETYSVKHAYVASDLRIGEYVVLSFVFEHYGPAARKVVLHVERGTPD